MGRHAEKMVFFLCPLLVAGLLLARGTAMAEGISGSAELLQASSDVKSTDASGQTSSVKTNTFFQRYQLDYSEMLYPYLNLRVGSGFQKIMSKSESDIGDSRATVVDITPSVALTLNNPFVYSGVGWSVREEKLSSNPGGPAVTNIQDRKNAFLGFRPEGLPTLDMQAARIHNYDKAHETTDNTTDSFTGTTRFTPVHNLDLAYIVTLLHNTDQLTGTVSDSTVQNARASYSNRFFDNRIGFSTDYSGVLQERETKQGSGGDVFFQLFPIAGLSNITNTPTLDVLSPNSALLDGNLVASSGINIGQSVSLGGDTRLREVGLDFGTATAVNTLYIYVDQQLPASVANTVAWDVYVSSDNQNWTRFQTGLHGVFNPFTNRFELLFPDVTTRYIKAATQPLAVTVLPPPGTDISNVLITELQSFIRRPSAQAAGKTKETNQLFDVNVTAAILEKQLLVYTFYFSEVTSSEGSPTTFLSNALSSFKQFNRVFSGTARIAEDISRDQSGRTVAYSGTATLTAVPLPTLYHSLVVSTRKQETNGLQSSTESIFLNNYATLYKGIDMNLSYGVSVSSVPTGGSSTSTILNGGASFVPNKSLSINVNRSETQSTGLQSNHAVNNSGSVAWTPFDTVYLAYSISDFYATNTLRQRTQTFSTTWSPFNSGALNFNAQYSETVSSPAETTDVTKALAAQWRVGPRIYLTVGYTLTSSTAPAQTVDAKNISTDLRMTF